MIKLSGRAMHGLDEFMLRTGHLKVVSNVASEVGGARHRVERAAAEMLMSSTEVPSSQLEQVSRYLELKHLCPIQRDDPAVDTSRFRYPDLIVADVSGVSVRSSGVQAIEIWWQDFCLSDPRVRSAVGGVTAEAKSGSKTGLSHVFDWAESLGLLSSSAQATPMGRLLAKLQGNTSGMRWLENPYILLEDRVILGFLLLTADLDVFSRFICRLAGSTFPLTKRAGARQFAAAVVDLVDEVDAATYLGTRQQFHLGDLLRDLQRSARRNAAQLGDTSIAWHRAASRLETYVDLGFLAKDTRSPAERYDYIYYPTPLLEQVALSLRETSEPEEWIDRQLVRSILGHPTEDESLNLDCIRKLLPPVLEAIRSPSRVLPIDAVTIGIVQLAARKGYSFSVGGVRNAVEELAKKHPDVARLARGSQGQRAEFVTIDYRRLSS